MSGPRLQCLALATQYNGYTRSLVLGALLRLCRMIIQINCVWVKHANYECRMIWRHISGAKSLLLRSTAAFVRNQHKPLYTVVYYIVYVQYQHEWEAQAQMQRGNSIAESLHPHWDWAQWGSSTQQHRCVVMRSPCIVPAHTETRRINTKRIDCVLCFTCTYAPLCLGDATHQQHACRRVSSAFGTLRINMRHHLCTHFTQHMSSASIGFCVGCALFVARDHDHTSKYALIRQDRRSGGTTQTRG